MSVSKYRYTTLISDKCGGLVSFTADNDYQVRREIKMYLAHKFGLFRVKDEDVDKIIINKQPEKLTDLNKLKL